jgi:hypothetical protein
VGECRICEPPEPVPDHDLVDHVRVLHPAVWDALARWPDGAVVISYDEFGPDDITDIPGPPRRQEEVAKWFRDRPWMDDGDLGYIAGTDKPKSAAYGLWQLSEMHIDYREYFMTQLDQDLKTAIEGRHPAVQDVCKYFMDGGHLPTQLQIPFEAVQRLVIEMLGYLPDCPQLTIGLQDLLRAKDAFVRSAL